MAQVNINGKSFTGDNISIVGNRVIVDGKNLDLNEFEEKEINIIVEGNAQAVETTSGHIIINGNVEHGIDSVSGNIEVYGNVDGDIDTTSGDVQVGGDINGDIDTVSGDITKY